MPVDATHLLETVRDVWKPIALAHAIDLRVECRLGSGAIVVDSAKLFRGLDNLVKNAIEAIGPEPGEISVSINPAESPQAAVRISVSDSGGGIPESIDVFRLFETTKLTGTGLGLSIARRIVEAQGGTLTFAAGHPRGTVFHIDLPHLSPHLGTG
jgi:two-component system sensor kinase FixL